MKTIKDYDVKGKKVILRCDFNVPMIDGKISDDTRIKASLKTINYLIDNDAKIIILSHLGKVKTKQDKKSNSLYQVYLKLKELLNTNVYFSKNTTGIKLEEYVSNLKEKEVLLVENTRYEDIDDKKESQCDMKLSKYWARLGDIFINDAYGTLHRKHASNVGVCMLLPNGIGFLVEEELNKIDSFLNENTNPFVVIMGGKKVSDKIKVIDNLILKCDKLLIGGAMSFTFLYSKGFKVNKEYVELEQLDYCKNLLTKYKDKIILPLDFKVSTSLEDTTYLTKDIENIEINDKAYDIGSKTIDLFKDNLNNAKRVLINGPMGVFENKLYEEGTKEIYQYLTDNNIKTLIGGGDSASSVNKLGFENKFYHVSTGGGATLEYLEGKGLPGLRVINR